LAPCLPFLILLFMKSSIWEIILHFLLCLYKPLMLSNFTFRSRIAARFCYDPRIDIVGDALFDDSPYHLVLRWVAVDLQGEPIFCVFDTEDIREFEIETNSYFDWEFFKEIIKQNKKLWGILRRPTLYTRIYSIIVRIFISF
jgi:hypothetical protein